MRGCVAGVRGGGVRKEKGRREKEEIATRWCFGQAWLWCFGALNKRCLNHNGVLIGGRKYLALSLMS